MEAKATQGGQENVTKEGSQPKRSDCDDKVPAISSKFRKFLQVLESYTRSNKFRQVLQVPTIEESGKKGCFFEEAGSIEDPA